MSAGVSGRWSENAFRADVVRRLEHAQAPLSLLRMAWDEQLGAWTQPCVGDRPAPPALLAHPWAVVDATDHGFAVLPLGLDGRCHVRIGGRVSGRRGTWRIDPADDDVRRRFAVAPGRAQLSCDAGARGRVELVVRAVPDAPVVAIELTAVCDDDQLVVEPELWWLPGERGRLGDDGLWLAPADPGEPDPVIVRNNSIAPDPLRPPALVPARFALLGAPLDGEPERIGLAGAAAGGRVCLGDRAFPVAAVEALRLGRWHGGGRRLLALALGADVASAEQAGRAWLERPTAQEREDVLGIDLPDAAIERQARFSAGHALAARAHRADGGEIFVHGRRDRGYGDVAHLHQSYQMHLPALASGAGASVRSELIAFATLAEADGNLARAPRPGAGEHPYVGLYTNAHLLLAVHRYLAWTGDADLLDAPCGDATFGERTEQAASFLLARRWGGMLEPCGWLDAWPPDVRAQSQISLAGAMGLAALAEVCAWRGDAGAGARWAAAAEEIRAAVLARCHDGATGLIAEHVFDDGSRGGTFDDFWAHTQIWAALAGAAPDRRGLDAVRDACLAQGMRVVPPSSLDARYVADSTDGSDDLALDSTATWLLACWPELTHLYALAELRAGRPDLALGAVAAQLPERLHAARSAAAPHYYAEKYLTPGDLPWLCTWAGDPTLVEVLLTMLGVRPGLDGLRIAPALPPAWCGQPARVRFSWRGARWELVLDPHAAAGSVQLDGRPLPAGAVLQPAARGARHVVRAGTGGLL